MKLYKDLFEEDDYNVLDKKYFGILRRNRDIVADPSGWVDTFSNVGNAYSIFEPRIQGYNIDISNQLNDKKKYILELISAWDSFSYSMDNITLCHSATVSSVILMAFLKSKGVKTILFETPNYFATISQAEIMGFNIIKIPTYYENDFHLNIADIIYENDFPKVIWLTQPRTALGFNQNIEEINQLLMKLSSNDFLVIDEATEQFFPSVLSSFNPLQHPKIIKIRSFFKGLGINGVRLAYIAHHESYRIEISNQMETFLGALDIFSLEHAVEIAKNISKFKILLSIANEQVTTLKERAEKLINNTNCEVSKIENGYIGSAILKFKNSNLTQQQKRLKFIEYCVNKKTPVILGASMGFAFHENVEFIRLNYFNRDFNILEGLRIISSFNY